MAKYDWYYDEKTKKHYKKQVQSPTASAQNVKTSEADGSDWQKSLSERYARAAAYDASVMGKNMPGYTQTFTDKRFKLGGSNAIKNSGIVSQFETYKNYAPIISQNLANGMDYLGMSEEELAEYQKQMQAAAEESVRNYNQATARTGGLSSIDMAGMPKAQQQELQRGDTLARRDAIYEKLKANPDQEYYEHNYGEIFGDMSEREYLDNFTAYLRDQQRKEQAAAKGNQFAADAAELEKAIQSTEGYAEKSQYIPRGEYWMPGSDDYNIIAGSSRPDPLDTTTEDERNNRVKYSFLNDFMEAVRVKDTWAVEDMKNIAGNLGVLFGYDLDAMSHMDENQIRTSFAYLNNDDYAGFENYLKTINYDISRDSFESRVAEEETAAQDRNFWEHMGASLTTFPMKALSSANGIINDTRAWLDKFGIIDVDPRLEHEYSPANMWGVASDIRRSGTEQYLEDKTSGLTIPENIPIIGGYNIAGSAYQGLMNIGDVALARGFGNWLGKGLGLVGKTADTFSKLVSGAHMFGMEVDSSIREAMSAGQDNYALKATGDGIISAIWENIGLDKILSGNVFKAALGEGTEEFFTGTTQKLWDVLLNKGNSKPAELLDQYKIMGYGSKAEWATALDIASDLFSEFMGGFVSGGASGGSNAISTAIQNRTFGNNLTENGGEEALASLAESVPVDDKAKDIARRLRDEIVERRKGDKTETETDDAASITAEDAEAEARESEMADRDSAEASELDKGDKTDEGIDDTADVTKEDADAAARAEEMTERDRAERAGEGKPIEEADAAAVTEEDAEAAARTARDRGESADMTRGGRAEAEIDDTASVTEEDVRALTEAEAREWLNDEASWAESDEATETDAAAKDVAEEPSAINADAIASDYADTAAKRGEIEAREAERQQRRNERKAARDKGRKAVTKAEKGYLFRQILANLDKGAQQIVKDNFSRDMRREIEAVGYTGNAKEAAKVLSDFINGEVTPRALELLDGFESLRNIALSYMGKIEMRNNLYKQAGELSERAQKGYVKPEATTAEEGADEIADTEEDDLGYEEMEDDGEDSLSMPERDTGIEESDTPESTYDGKTVTIESVKTIPKIRGEYEYRVTVKDADGNTYRVSAADISFGSNDGKMAEIMTKARELKTDVDTAISMFNPETQDVSEYIAAWNAASEYGFDGRSIDVVKADASINSVLTPEQIEAAYNLEREFRREMSDTGGIFSTYRRRRYASVPTGKVDTSAINMRNLKPNQKAAIRAMSSFAKAVGFNLRFVESVSDADGKYRTENGSWDPATLTLTLDIHAGSNKAADINYAMMHTAGHELTHFIKQFADGDLWNDYQEFVIGHLSKKGDAFDLAGAIKKHMDRGLFRDSALEEVIADASGEALMNITEADIQSIAETNPTLLNKIKNFFKKWISNLKKRIADAYAGTEAKTEEAKMMQDVVDEMSKRWNELFVNATKNKNKAVASETTIDSVEDAVASDTFEQKREAAPHTRVYTDVSDSAPAKKGATSDNRIPQHDSKVKYSERNIDQTQTDAFKHWFGDSKIVNTDGTPKVMYHGSPNQFRAFDKRKAKSSGLYGRGFYFTDSKSHGGTYGELYEVYLSIKHPITPGGDDVTRRQVRKFLEAVAENEDDYSIENYGTYDIDKVLRTVYRKDAFAVIQDVNATAIGDMVEAVKLFNEVNGTDFDGIVVDTETVAFEPTQIKSATDNIGTFDPGDSDIYHQERDYSVLSDRELLVEALETDLKPVEREHLEKYAGRIDDLNRQQQELETLHTQIAEMRAEGKTATNSSEMLTALDKAKKLRGKIDRADAKLKEIESADMIREVVRRTREETRRKTAEQVRARADERMRKEVERVRGIGKRRTKEAVERSEERIENLRRRLEETRESGKRRLEISEERRRKAAERAGERIDKLRNKVVETREAGKRNVERVKDSHDTDKYRKQILADVRRIHSWIASPTSKGYAPEFMREPLAELIDSIDFTSARGLKGGDPTKADAKFTEALDKMREAVTRLNKAYAGLDEGAEAFSGYIDLPADFADEFDALVSKIKGVISLRSGISDAPFFKMSADQLHEMAKMFRILKSSIMNVNRLVANSRYDSAQAASTATIDDMNEMSARKKTHKAFELFNSVYNWKNATPIYAFERLGRGGRAIFEGLQDGWDRMAANSRRVVEYAKNTFKGAEKIAWSSEITDVELDSGDVIKMTTAQKMSLYCHSKREQSMGHLMGGGIRIADIDGKRGTTISQTEDYILTEGDIARIIGSLTDRQREVADALQAFMNDVCAMWGNEISMKRFGFEQMTEKNYFPIETDANNRSKIDESKDGSSSMFRLLNMSSLKPLTPNANNAIVIKDIFNVFNDHASDMAKYNALALPILDFIKWYNYVEKTDVLDADGKPTGKHKTRSVQKSLERAYGKDAKSYLLSFIKDLNAEQDGGRNDNLINSIIGKAKSAAVGANLRVYGLQVTSLPRAAYAINPKYLAIGAAHIKSGNALRKNVGILQWKDLGFYSTDIARSMRGLVNRDDNILGKIRNWQMVPAGWGDQVVSSIICEAVAAEMQDKYPSLATGSDAYKTVFNRRVREIIYKTQVVDSTMTRSEFMRSKGLMSTLTAFMSEPTLTLNMLNESIQKTVESLRKGESLRDALRNTRGLATRAATTFVATAFLTTLMESMFDALRDDDEYETLLEKFNGAFTGNLIDNVNIFAMLPYIKDVLSIFQGYENSSLITQGWQQVQDFRTAIESWQNGKAPIYRVIYNGLKATSSMSGVGVGNATRDVVSLYNTFLAPAWDTPKLQTYADTESAAAKAYYGAVKESRTDDAEYYMQRMEAVDADMGKVSDKMVSLIGDDFVAGNITETNARKWLKDETGMADDKINTKIRDWSFKAETGISYSEFKGAYAAGIIAEAEAKRLLKKYRGYDDNEIYFTLLKWKGGEDWSRYDAFLDAVDAQGNFAAEARKLLDHGVNKSDIASEIAKAYKDAYREIHGTSEGDRLLEYLLDVYESIGYDRDYERKYITKNWLKD